MKMLITVGEFSDMGMFGRIEFLRYCKEVGINLEITTEQKMQEYYKNKRTLKKNKKIKNDNCGIRV